MQRIYKVLGRDQESRSPFSANLAFVCFLFSLSVALLAIPSSNDAEAAAVSPTIVEFSAGQDADPDSNQRPVDDADDVDDEMERRLQEASSKIEEAIAAGAITAEQGRERLEALRKRLAERKDRAESGDDDGEDPADVIRRR
ncbi:MAG: hypothetical protein VX949_05470, partial [Planctomycetota bacterium]|nr:hypothetical protein [Planctomycetota bacterium]